MSCVWLVDPHNGPTICRIQREITNGETVSEMRIDADVDLFGSEPIEGVFDLVGIGGQFVNEAKKVANPAATAKTLRRI